MASGIYYQLSNVTNTLTFVLESFDNNKTRMVWDMDIPFVQDPFVSDQVSTKKEISLTCALKAGTGQPYSTVKDIETALDNLTPDNYTTGWSFTGGDWNGATWAANSNYPFAYPKAGATSKLAVTMVRLNWKAGESYSDGEINCTITLRLGQVF